jgi:hypothetical protein
MHKQIVYIPVVAIVPDYGDPGRPDQGLPPGAGGYPPSVGIPGFPDQGLPPEPPSVGIPGFPDQGLPGDPDYPDQGLPPIGGRPPRPPRPPREVFPVIPDAEIGGHPDLPDMDAPGRWEKVSTQKAASYPAFVPDPRNPPKDPDHDTRPPTFGHPGTWVTILYHGAPTWAWVPSIDDAEPEPEEPERAPK